MLISRFKPTLRDGKNFCGYLRNESITRTSKKMMLNKNQQTKIDKKNNKCNRLLTFFKTPLNAMGDSADMIGLKTLLCTGFIYGTYNF